MQIGDEPFFVSISDNDDGIHGMLFKPHYLNRILTISGHPLVRIVQVLRHYTRSGLSILLTAMQKGTSVMAKTSKRPRHGHTRAPCRAKAAWTKP